MIFEKTLQVKIVIEISNWPQIRLEFFYLQEATFPKPQKLKLLISRLFTHKHSICQIENFDSDHTKCVDTNVYVVKLITLSPTWKETPGLKNKSLLFSYINAFLRIDAKLRLLQKCWCQTAFHLCISNQTGDLIFVYIFKTFCTVALRFDS